MKRKREHSVWWLKGCILIVLFLIVIPQARAHNLWLGLDHYRHSIGETATVFLYLAHSLPFADPAKPEKMETFFYLTPSGDKKTFDLKEPDPESIFYEVGVPLNLREEGTYLAAVAMKPVFVSVTPEGRKRKSKKELPDAISCRYVQFSAKAIFHAGKPAGDAYRTVLGQAMEIVPQKDPGLLKVGDCLPVKILLCGKPLAGEFVYGTYVGFSTREEYAYTTKTDHDGIAMIRITTPGIWWVKVPYKKPHEDKSECDVDQYAAILTFEVR